MYTNLDNDTLGTCFSICLSSFSDQLSMRKVFCTYRKTYVCTLSAKANVVRSNLNMHFLRGSSSGIELALFKKCLPKPQNQIMAFRKYVKVPRKVFNFG